MTHWQMEGDDLAAVAEKDFFFQLALLCVATTIAFFFGQLMLYLTMNIKKKNLENEK